jgi:hypothetical protein
VGPRRRAGLQPPWRMKPGTIRRTRSAGRPTGSR